MDEAIADPLQAPLAMAADPKISCCRVQHDLARHASPYFCLPEYSGIKGVGWPHLFHGAA